MIDRLIVRADASPQVGLGHIMRSLALVEEAQDRAVDVQVVSRSETAADVLEGRVPVLVVADEDRWRRDLQPSDVVLFDGYRFGPDDHQAVRSCGARVAAVDDLGSGDYPVDVLINQNLPTDLRYEALETTRVLVGPQYALVRREFRQCRRPRGEAGEPLLVTMGGSDAAGLTLPVVRMCLEDGPFERAIVLLGPLASGPDLPDNVEVVHGPDTVADVFDRCDAAISAAGATTWELLCMGVPCALVQVADNQRHIGRPVAERGAALFAGGLPLDKARLHGTIRSLNERETRQDLSHRALELVDGLGAQRVLDALLEA